jgi:hypothetical protein
MQQQPAERIIYSWPGLDGTAEHRNQTCSWRAGPPRDDLFRRSGFVAFALCYYTRPGPEICTGEGRGGDQQQPSSFKAKEGKCFECHMRPCVLGRGWIDTRMRESSSSVPTIRRQVLRIIIPEIAVVSLERMRVVTYWR